MSNTNTWLYVEKCASHDHVYKKVDLNYISF